MDTMIIAKDMFSQLRKADQAYYGNTTAPIMSDGEYDDLKEKFIKLLENDPDIRLSLGPLVDIVGFEGKDYEKTCLEPVLTIEKAYSVEDLKLFYRRVSRALSPAIPDFVAVPILDGYPIALLYIDGVLVRILGRVYKESSENLLEKLHDNPSIRKVLETQNRKAPPPVIEIYGTLCIGDQLTPTFFATDIGYSVEFPAFTYKDLPDIFTQWGFKTIALISSGSQITSEERFITFFTVTQDFFNKDIDIIVNDPIQREIIGKTSVHPKWSIRAVFDSNKNWSYVRNITWELNEKGYIEPYAHIDPIVIQRTTISKIPLRDIERIDELDLRIDDKVLIHLKGGLIPDIIFPINHLSSSKPYKLIAECPFCSKLVSQHDRMVGSHVFYCASYSEYLDKTTMSILEEVGPKKYNIGNLSIGVIRALLHNKIIGVAEDLVRLPIYRDFLMDSLEFSARDCDTLFKEIVEKMSFAITETHKNRLPTINDTVDFFELMQKYIDQACSMNFYMPANSTTRALVQARIYSRKTLRIIY